ncbi:hypothetical protein HDU85_006018 [Gaertneriomyces sp. JEL0708]|nr:hypothetical protein HDU85_006018 [Gaertneriomyces sp. JEL0708]
MGQRDGHSKLPKNWPTHLRYLSRNEWNKNIPTAISSFYLSHPSPDQTSPTSTPFPLHPSKGVGPSRLVRITSITDPSHPAYNQHGLFATATLPPKSLILDYNGMVHLPATASSTSDYILSFDRMTGLSVDAATAGNEARFVNDFRGVAKQPNVAFEVYRDTRGEVKMGIWTLGSKVAKGEELLVSYGKGFWRERGVGV